MISLLGWAYTQKGIGQDNLSLSVWHLSDAWCATSTED